MISTTATATPITKIIHHQQPFFSSGIAECDRVLGGGIHVGAVILLGGDPGIGKSTLALQIAGNVSTQNSVLYVSGEESVQQIKQRAERITSINDNLFLLPSGNILDIEAAAKEQQPAIIIIDSIQTMYHPEIPSAPGSVGQVRESAAYIIRFAKEHNIAILIIGHVTKDGAIAGPKVLEHMVDTVLYFEGDQSQQYRIIRSMKNRFGSTHEIGIFDMRATGLSEVSDPSGIFIHREQRLLPGSMIVPIVEGTRSLLVEIQSLVTPSYLSIPRRIVTGLEQSRVHIISAVLEKKCGLNLGREDIIVNVASGIHIDDPAADAGIASAIFTSFREMTLTNKVCVFGEIGLSGELRPVPHADKRIHEASKLGFAHCIIPATNTKSLSGNAPCTIHGAESVQQLFATLDSLT